MWEEIEGIYGRFYRGSTEEVIVLRWLSGQDPRKNSDYVFVPLCGICAVVLCWVLVLFHIIVRIVPTLTKKGK